MSEQKDDISGGFIEEMIHFRHNEMIIVEQGNHMGPSKSAPLQETQHNNAILTLWGFRRVGGRRVIH